MMSPIIHLVRHAEAYHNVTRDWSIPDPDLTPNGVAQCDALNGRTTNLQSGITHFVSSPSYRCIRTALRSFSDVANRPLEAVINHYIQEVSDSPCNIPLNKEALEDKADEWIDTSMLENIDYTDRGADSPFRNVNERIVERARQARIWLRDLARHYSQTAGREAGIVVVTHGSFLAYMAMPSPGFWRPRRLLGWSNCQMRSFRFLAPNDDDDEAYLQFIDADA